MTEAAAGTGAASRRDLMREAGRAAARWAAARLEASPASLWLGAGEALVRPPGARAEPLFLALCTRCDACVAACPHLALRRAGPEAGPRRHGTPHIVPEENPCLLCDGLPCAAACKTGALKLPRAGVRPRIGTAVIEAALCLRAAAQPCDACAQSCPTAFNAVRAEPGGVRVDAAACTGCGFCVQACPSRALRVEALS